MTLFSASRQKVEGVRERSERRRDMEDMFTVYILKCTDVENRTPVENREEIDFLANWMLIYVARTALSIGEESGT